MNFGWIILIIAGYLLGSVPFAMIIAKAKGIDLRTIGSGNIGATNLSRAAGKKWGIFCFVLDALKGIVPMLIGAKLVSVPPHVHELFLWLAVGFATILGHVFPIFIGFKGGKGVSTSFGVALGLWPYFTLCAAIAMLIWLIIVAAKKYISLGSIIAAAFFPLILVTAVRLIDSWQMQNLWPLMIAAIIIPVMVIVSHIKNIKRLIAGTEHKIGQPKI
jgi:acyl phosphate:glycerol-3-phosphate acyltransferase